MCGLLATKRIKYQWTSLNTQQNRSFVERLKINFQFTKYLLNELIISILGVFSKYHSKKPFSCEWNFFPFLKNSLKWGIWFEVYPKIEKIKCNNDTFPNINHQICHKGAILQIMVTQEPAVVSNYFSFAIIVLSNKKTLKILYWFGLQWQI